MSNNNAVNDDELEREVNNDEQDVDQDSSGNADSEVDAAVEEHKKSVFEGMIQSNLQKVAAGEIKIDDIKGDKMRKEVETRLKKNLANLMPAAAEVKIDEDQFLAKVEQRSDLKGLLKEMPEDEHENARQEYEILKETKGHDGALKAVRMLHGIKTDEEKRAYAERSHKAGIASNPLDAVGKIVAKTKTEKAMVDFLKNLK